MATPRYLIEEALLELGVLAHGEAVEETEVTRAFTRMRWMLDQWTEDGTLVPFFTHLEHSVLERKAKFTVGAGEDTDLDGQPPSQVSTLLFRRNGQTYSSPLLQVSYNEWGGRYSELHDNPTSFYWERTWPVSTIYLSANCMPGDQFTISGQRYLSGSLSIDDDIGLPGTYDAAITFNLAVNISGTYGVKGQALSSSTRHMALTSLTTLRKANGIRVSKEPDPQLALTASRGMNTGYVHMRRSSR